LPSIRPPRLQQLQLLRAATASGLPRWRDAPES